MKKIITTEIKDLGLTHKIIVFMAIMLITIVIVRIIMLVKDPDIIIKGFELHHFYYGLVLLIITNLFMLFGKIHIRTSLALSAISIGLVADELLYVMGNMSEQKQYVSTLPSAIIFALLIVFIILFVKYISKKKK